MPRLKREFEGFLNKCVDGKWSVNEKGEISIEGNLNCQSYLKSIKKLNTGYLPSLDIIYISGDFNCSDNNLISLKNSPRIIGGSFKCFSNNITSLEFSPKEVGLNFDCMYNQIRSLEGCPESIDGNFIADFNNLENLIGGPKYVGGDYRVSTNNLNSLEGCAIEVGESFICENNVLCSLIGGPKKVGRNYICSQNSLNNLLGSPRFIKGKFICSNNRLLSLEGGPEEVTLDFDCKNNLLTNLLHSPKKVGQGFNASMNRLDSLEGLPIVQIEFLVVTSNKILDNTISILAPEVASGIPYKVSVALMWDKIDYKDQENLSHFLDYREVSDFILGNYSEDPIGTTKIYDRIPVHIRKRVIEEIKNSIDNSDGFKQTIENVSDLISSGIFDDDI